MQGGDQARVRWGAQRRANVAGWNENPTGEARRGCCHREDEGDASQLGNREIEFVPEAESNTRIAKGLAGVAQGIAALNRHREVAEVDLQDAFRVGVECLPELRAQLVLAAFAGVDVNMVGSRTNRERQIEELVALELFTERTLSDKCRGWLMDAGVRT